MSITFTPKSGSAISIGGGTTASIPGPFPTFSITREDIRLDDGTFLNTLYTISVTGNVTATGTYSTKGTRQGQLHGYLKTLVGTGANAFGSKGIGTLDIQPYGGANSMSFTDARIVSVEALEADEASGGIHYHPYSIQFQANLSNMDGGAQTYSLSSVNESWEFSNSDIITNEDEKSFTVTHTISAVGVATAADGNYAWMQAKAYVDKRAASALADINLEPIEGMTASSPANLGSIFTGFSSTATVNHVRTTNSNITAGEYGITDTWILAGSTAIVDIEISSETGEQVEHNTATVSGTITGLDSSGATAGTSDAYANAETMWGTIEGTLRSLANSSGVAIPATNGELTKNVGKNKNSATITFSVTYNDMQGLLAGSISESLQIDDSGGTDVVAIIGVILRASGPIIQDMGTLTEKRKSVTFTAKMKKSERGDQPDGGTIVEGYKPTASAGGSGPYLDTEQESWNPITGDYTLTREWVYV